MIAMTTFAGKKCKARTEMNVWGEVAGVVAEAGAAGVGRAARAEKVA